MVAATGQHHGKTTVTLGMVQVNPKPYTLNRVTAPNNAPNNMFFLKANTTNAPIDFFFLDVRPHIKI